VSARSNATSTKPDYEPVGLELVRYAAQAAPVAEIESKPWFAIGGISLDNIDAVIEAGARRVCVVRAITLAADPQDAAHQLRRKLQAAWKAEPAMDRYIAQALSGPGPSGEPAAPPSRRHHDRPRSGGPAHRSALGRFDPGYGGPGRIDPFGAGRLIHPDRRPERARPRSAWSWWTSVPSRCRRGRPSS
jgi:hypothetical protein